jgi:hypothetical protein
MMPHSYPKNDRDSFEELHVVVEQLELCQGLLRSRSHSKARAAVILLDHVADVLMYRVCNDDFERQAFLEMIIPSAVPAKKRAEILFRFDAKVSYLSQKKGLMSGESASVLLISHRVRNFAYHRDYYNPHTISVVGRILYKTVCEILPILAQEGQLSYSSNAKEQAWTKRYGVAAELVSTLEIKMNDGVLCQNCLKTSQVAALAPSRMCRFIPGATLFLIASSKGITLLLPWLFASLKAFLRKAWTSFSI